MVAIEADGYRHYSGRAAWHKDRIRWNALTMHGWLVLHLTWDDLEARPNELVAEIELALEGAANRER
jgi:very-short-patch-repair endonuclease